MQQNYVAILRFESEATLHGWMESPERLRLLEQAEGLTESVNSRIVRTGFSQWFPPQVRTQAPGWKMNMIVLLLLYPVVFLFGLWVQTSLLIGALNLPFWLALFIGNVVSVTLLNYLVPWTSQGFSWWLNTRLDRRVGVDFAGMLLICTLYGALLLLFSTI